MGSIRGPAANCGLFGIKPGLGIVPQEIGVDAWFGMSENGPLATTVSDAALLLSVMADRPELATPEEPTKPLRIAVGVGEPSGLVKTDPEFLRGLAETAAALREAGHTVTEAKVPYPANIVPLLARWFAGTAADAALLDAKKLEPRVRTHARMGRLFSRLGLLGEAPVSKIKADMLAFFGDYDVLLTPGLAQPGILAEEWHTRGWYANLMANIRYAPYQATWNLLKWPAACIPAGWHTTAGVPLSVQLVAPPSPDAGGEALILGLALQLERLRPWPRIPTDFES
jgi:amidase